MPSVPDNIKSSTHYHLLLLSTFLWYETTQKDNSKKMGISFWKHLCQSRLHLWLSGLQDGVICYLKEKYINRIKRDDIKLQFSSLSFPYSKDTAWTIFANLAGYVTTDYPNVLTLMLFSQRLYPLYFSLLFKSCHISSVNIALYNLFSIMSNKKVKHQHY